MTQYPPPGAPQGQPYGDPGPMPPPYSQQPYPPAGPYAVPVGPPFHQPGVVPLRPLLLGDLLGGAITTIRRNPKATVGMGALVTFVFMLVPIVVTLVVGVAGGLPDLDLLDPDPDSAVAPVATLDAASLISTAFSALAAIVVTGLIMRVVQAAVAGERTTAAEVWRRGRGRLPRLVGLALLIAAVAILVVGVPIAIAVAVGVLLSSLLAGVLIGLVGLLGGIVLAVFLYVRYALLATPALVIEGTGVFASLSRASVLSRGQFWRLLGIALLAGLVASLASSVVTIPFTLLGVVGMFVFHGTWFSMVSMLLGSYLSVVVKGAVISPFSGGVTALQYYDQRFRKEGHDIELLERALGRAPERP